jgi:hypothetical protein
MGGKHRKTHSTPSADLDFPSVGDCFTGSLTSSAGTITETAGGNVVTYTATLNTPAATALSIPYTLGGTATAITDYTVNTGTINIAAGALTGTLVLTATPDFLTETGGETVSVALNAIAGATVNTTPVTTAITDTSTTPAPGAFTNVQLANAPVTANPAVAEAFIFDFQMVGGRPTKAASTGEVTITGFNAATDKLVFNDVGTGTVFTEAQFMVLPGVVIAENPFAPTNTTVYVDPLAGVLGGVTLVGIQDKALATIVLETTA